MSINTFEVKLTDDSRFPFKLTVIGYANQRIELDLDIEDFAKLETALSNARSEILAKTMADAKGGE